MNIVIRIESNRQGRRAEAAGLAAVCAAWVLFGLLLLL